MLSVSLNISLLPLHSFNSPPSLPHLLPHVFCSPSLPLFLPPSLTHSLCLVSCLSRSFSLSICTSFSWSLSSSCLKFSKSLIVSAVLSSNWAACSTSTLLCSSALILFPYRDNTTWPQCHTVHSQRKIATRLGLKVFQLQVGSLLGITKWQTATCHILVAYNFYSWYSYAVGSRYSQTSFKHAFQINQTLFEVPVALFVHMSGKHKFSELCWYGYLNRLNTLVFKQTTPLDASFALWVYENCLQSGCACKQGLTSLMCQVQEVFPLALPGWILS